MKEKNAYFTVEAAMVFPIVISVILFVIYMQLFQYNRCLMEQDLGAIALWGSLTDASDTTDLEQKTRTRITEMYRDKYAAWEITALDITLEKNVFSVRGTGQLTFPVSGWNFWSTENVWGMEADYGYNRLSPVTFIRLCHKFKTWQEENEDTER